MSNDTSALRTRRISIRSPLFSPQPHFRIRAGDFQRAVLYLRRRTQESNSISCSDGLCRNTPLRRSHTASFFEVRLEFAFAHTSTQWVSTGGHGSSRHARGEAAVRDGADARAR